MTRRSPAAQHGCLASIPKNDPPDRFCELRSPGLMVEPRRIELLTS